MGEIPLVPPDACPGPHPRPAVRRPRTGVGRDVVTAVDAAAGAAPWRRLITDPPGVALTQPRRSVTAAARTLCSSRRSRCETKRSRLRRLQSPARALNSVATALARSFDLHPRVHRPDVADCDCRRWTRLAVRHRLEDEAFTRRARR